ncbi:MAG: 3'(2'),5'-bisphosphate nucleotidase CysQ [Acidimicrobiales bacterium]|nr:3'(2'),5'-bisphosphate nucleotidase CysQ [Acidimicrobiia bacterium]NNC81563.1 3'(2'),5'-bisphosphate nucleotidase CysQ [Acidimicrobiales bacterium]RZV43686.1 MAG: 3'(2'),5'-bisphosphate nucleotidase CysQ [Acidimicrobiales bacterium]
MKNVTADDHFEAARIATAAGELLLSIRDEMSSRGADSREMKDVGDEQSHLFIMEELRRVRPDDAILSEEGKDDLARLDADRIWIVDPVDGTREFSEPPRTDWAVHVAMVIDGEPVVGAVALPALGITLSTAEPPVIPEVGATPPRMIVSRTRPPAAATLVAEQLGAELVEMGSAGAKAMSVVRGESEMYAHSGGQYEWDSCAPAAVALAAGLHVSRADGSPMTYNHADPYLPDLLICRKEYAEDALRVLAEAEAD